LNADEKSEPERFTKTGSHSVRSVNRTKIILELDEENGHKPLTQTEIAEQVGVFRQTVNDTKDAFFAAENTPELLKRKKRKAPPINA
jgi:hypothetical protein